MPGPGPGTWGPCQVLLQLLFLHFLGHPLRGFFCESQTNCLGRKTELTSLLSRQVFTPAPPPSPFGWPTSPSGTPGCDERRGPSEVGPPDRLKIDRIVEGAACIPSAGSGVIPEVHKTRSQLDIRVAPEAIERGLMHPRSGCQHVSPQQHSNTH